MRIYHPDYTSFGISRERYKELLAFCRQYQEWKAEASSLLGVGAQKYSSMPHGTDVGDPVFKMVARREVLLDKIRLVEEVAEAVDGGKWRAALIQNICMGKALRFIDPVLLPTSHQNSFYKQKKTFFLLLNQKLNDKV